MTDDEKAMEELPNLVKELTMLNSEDFNEFEVRISKCLNKTIAAFEEMVDTGVLSTDPEQMVNAMKVLVTAKKDIAEHKRKLVETTMRGLVLKNATTPKEKPMTALEKYYERQQLSGNAIEDSSSNSMFGEINDSSPND